MLVASFHPFFWGKKQLFSHISAAPKSYSYPSPATSQNLHSSLIMMIMTHPSVYPKKKFGPFLIIRTYLCVELPEKMRGPWNFFFCVDSTHKSVKTSICSDVLLLQSRIISRQSSSKQLLEKSCELWLNFHIIFRTLCCWVIFIDFHCTTKLMGGTKKSSE